MNFQTNSSSNSNSFTILMNLSFHRNVNKMFEIPFAYKIKQNAFDGKDANENR